MQAFLIDPAAKLISPVEIDDGLQGVRRLIGFDSIDADEIDDKGDRLYFDESCFIREHAGTGRFQLDRLAPVSGRAVVIGGDASGKALRAPLVTLEALQARVRFA
jgi:hypothetical protein